MYAVKAAIANLNSSNIYPALLRQHAFKRLSDKCAYPTAIGEGDQLVITAIVEELLAAHPDEVEAFRGGKNKLQGFFVGQLMKKTGGKADPKLANQILSQKLKG